MDDDNKAPAGPEPFDRETESVWHLLYRYLWPFQYFRDVTQGDRRQQQSSYQHNRLMRFCLPGFMCKWSALSAQWFAWGSFLDGTLVVAGCFVAATLALIMVLLLGIDWLWLSRFSDRF